MVSNLQRNTETGIQCHARGGRKGRRMVSRWLVNMQTQCGPGTAGLGQRPSDNHPG